MFQFRLCCGAERSSSQDVNGANTVGRVVLSSSSAGKIRWEFPGILAVLSCSQVRGQSTCPLVELVESKEKRILCMSLSQMGKIWQQEYRMAGKLILFQLWRKKGIWSCRTRKHLDQSHSIFLYILPLMTWYKTNCVFLLLLTKCFLFSSENWH